MTSSKNRGKYLSYLLRHHPEEVGCTLDEYGSCIRRYTI
jgi:RNA:NAD 2'-phosphotransferase (TPT1/KptA family)